MVAAAFVVLLFFGGLVLTGMILPFVTIGGDPVGRYVGWALVVIALMQWRTVLEGVRKSGKLLALLLVVAALALVFNGERGLWEMFF